MKHQRFLNGLIVATLGCALVYGAATPAHAFFGGRWGGSGGGSGGGSWGGSGGGSWGGSGGGSGGSYGGGSYSGYGSAGGYASSSAGSAGGYVTHSAPVNYGHSAGQISSGHYVGSVSNDARLAVSVPADARITVNGRSTRSMGDLRRYVSRGLQPGKEYRYEIRAQVTRDGQELDETKVVSIRASDQTQLAFNFNSAKVVAQKPVETRLTVKLPATATLKLAGAETAKSGSVRTFSTTKLAADSKWDGYRVEVTYEHDGRTLTREKTISLKGGDAMTLAFEFDDTELAETKAVAAR